MLPELLKSFQEVNTALHFAPLVDGGSTPLHLAARLATCMEHFLSTPGIDVDTAFKKILLFITGIINVKFYSFY